MPKSLSQLASRLFEHSPRSLALSVVLPETCIACRGPRVGPLPLCARCRRGLGTVSRSECDAASAPWPEVSSLTAAWHLDPGSPARALVHELKYRSMPGIGRTIGALLGTLCRDDLAAPPDVVVPVPLHRVRLRERGYNQAEEIAIGLAASLGASPVVRALLRPRATWSQTRRGRSARSAATSGAFALAPNAGVAGRTVLLVDDVFTTGATAASAASTLLDGGARRVHVAVAGLTTARRYGAE